MNIKESIQQINELIEAWELNEACLNQTDIDAIKCLLKQNQELKKQLEDLLTQQKEFIKYLEDEIKQINPKILDDGELNLRLDDIKYTQYLTYKEILQKYKEIIGDDK